MLNIYFLVLETVTSGGDSIRNIHFEGGAVKSLRSLSMCVYDIKMTLKWSFLAIMSNSDDMFGKKGDFYIVH